MQVFLSHDKSDGPFVRELAVRLSASGLDVWLDEQHLYPGDNWAMEIGKALQSSRAMVVVLSPSAAKSPWVARDVEFALGSRQYEGRLIGVVSQPTKNIPWIFEKLPLFREDDAAVAAKRVVEELSGGVKVAG